MMARSISSSAAPSGVRTEKRKRCEPCSGGIMRFGKLLDSGGGGG